jgi:hypothetical protein
MQLICSVNCPEFSGPDSSGGSKQLTRSKKNIVPCDHAASVTPTRPTRSGATWMTFGCSIMPATTPALAWAAWALTGAACAGAASAGARPPSTAPSSRPAVPRTGLKMARSLASASPSPPACAAVTSAVCRSRRHQPQLSLRQLGTIVDAREQVPVAIRGHDDRSVPEPGLHRLDRQLIPPSARRLMHHEA